MSTKKISPTPLHNAVKQGDLQVVLKLLKKGDSILAMDSNRNTPLHLAHLLQHADISDQILAHIKFTHSYDKNPKNKHGLSHLHIACARGNAEAVANFELAGANVKDIIGNDSPLHAGYSCLQLACKSKSLETITIIVKVTKLLYSCLEDKKDTFSYMMSLQSFDCAVIKIHHEPEYFDDHSKLLMSTLQAACFHGDVKKVEALLEQGKDVEEAMDRKAKACPLYKPLHFAVEADKNRQQTVEMLLTYGADVNWKNGFCMTPLHLAMYNDNHRESKTALRKVFLVDDTLAVLYKATKAKEANPMDAFGLTYFHIAVACNDMELVTKLMDKGEGDCKPILPNLKNFTAYTPLHFAVKYGHEDMAKLLIERGANVNANESDNRFKTPLQVAISYGQHQMINFLLANGANAKVVDSDSKMTTLHLLAERFGDYEDEKSGPLGIIEKLVELDVNVDAKDSRGDTALHEACRKIKDKAEIVEELLKCGADVNLRNKEGMTAFDFISFSKSHADFNTYFKIYLHVQKLKDFGLKVDENNEKFCEKVMKNKNQWKKSEDWPEIQKMTSAEELTLRHEERLSEIEKLKCEKLDEKVSLYDYIKLDAVQAAKYIENQRIKEVTADKNLYENYGYMISLTHKESLRWLKAQDLKKKKPAETTSSQDTLKKASKKKKNKVSTQSIDSKVIKISDQPMPANSTLHSVIILGNIQWTQELLQKGASLETIDTDGNSPLHLAFILKHNDIVDLILAHMNNAHLTVDFRNNIGLSYLHIAAARGHSSLVQKLADCFAKPLLYVNDDSPLFPGYTAVRFACDAKSLETLRVLSLALKPFLDMPPLELEGFAIVAREFHLSCRYGSLADVERHLKRGADVNAISYLHYAMNSKSQPRQKVELLLKYGADVTRKNGTGQTVLHVAFHKENSVVELLYDLLVKGKEDNPMDVFGLTYFHIAVARNDLPSVKRMLYNGEDVNGSILPNSRNFDNYTPLHFAIKCGHVEMTKLLVERGANVNANVNDLRFLTPLQLAIECGRNEMIDVLLEKEVDAKIVRPDDKATMIHLLTKRYGEIDENTEEGLDEKAGLDWVVEKLVKRGVDIDAKDSDGDTALHKACLKWNKCSQLVEWLLINGADVNVKNKEGETPLEVACRGPSLEMNFESMMEVYDHLQKMKDLGLEVDPKNEKFGEVVMKKGRVGENAKKKKKRLNEIEKMKKDMLTEEVSIYDYLKMSPEQAADYAKTERIQNIIEDDEPRVLYDFYGYLIPVIYRKSLKCIEENEGEKKKGGKKTHRGKRRRS